MIFIINELLFSDDKVNVIALGRILIGDMITLSSQERDINIK